jgi:hypothetical protein
VELGYVTQVEMGICGLGVHLSHIARKEIGHVGGGGAVGSFFFRLPLAVARGLVSGGVEGMVGVSMGIVIGMPSMWGARDG